MKKLGLFLICLSLPAVFIACGKKEDKKEESGAPASTCLVQNCDNSEYANFSAQGFSRYDTSGWGGYSYIGAQTMTGNYSGFGMATSRWGEFCGCPVNSTPTYHPARGLGCVNNTYLLQYGGAVVFWALQPNQQQFSSFSASTAAQRISANSYNGFGGMNSFNNYNCSNFVTETCYVNQVDGCKNGASCRPTINGSALGICVN